MVDAAKILPYIAMIVLLKQSKDLLFTLIGSIFIIIVEYILYVNVSQIQTKYRKMQTFLSHFDYRLLLQNIYLLPIINEKLTLIFLN